MSAVLGGDPDEVLAAIEKHGLTPANMNGAGQIVAAGALDGLEALKADPPAKARIMPLSVAGAFHTAYMASAREELEGLVDGLQPGRPEPAAALQRRRARRRPPAPRRCPGWSARSPARCASTLCLATMRELGVTAVLELPPAGALAGLAKREWKGAGIEILALTQPGGPRPRPRAPRRRARARREPEHSPTGGSSSPPARGTVSPVDGRRGHPPARRHAAGRIRSRREEVNVSAGYDGVLAEWLVHEGDLVDAGDPIARLYPEVSE